MLILLLRGGSGVKWLWRLGLRGRCGSGWLAVRRALVQRVVRFVMDHEAGMREGRCRKDPKH